MAEHERIPCGHCQGTGTMDLPEPLRLPLAALSETPRTVEEIYHATLRRLGLAATVGKRGKATLWVRAGHQPKIAPLTTPPPTLGDAQAPLPSVVQGAPAPTQAPHWKEIG